MKEIFFTEAYKNWRGETTIKDNSLAIYDRIYSCYMEQYIGNKNVRDITEQDIDVICENFRSHGLSAKYGTLISTVLADVFNWCIKEKYMAGFPFVIKINV